MQGITVEDRGDRIAVVLHSQQREIAFAKDCNPSVVREAIINESLPELQRVMHSIIGFMTESGT